MDQISKIIIKNFKFFYEEVVLNFKEKPNMLVFGGNGSGKSSLYWALYTFLQSVFKSDDDEIKKYFDREDIEHNLINKFSIAPAESEISLEYKADDDTRTIKTISFNTINTKSGNLVKTTTLVSDFLNYRLLLNLYNWSHSDEIDIFSLFANDLFMFMTFSNGVNANDLWQTIRRGLNPRPTMHSLAYKQFEQRIATFNDDLNTYLNRIIETANEYLTTEFKEPLKILFEFEPCTYNDFIPGSSTKRNHRVKPPRIILTVEYSHSFLPGGKSEIKRPHSFLNEARLTSIALAIRFAIIDDKYINDAPKLLVLDDLLISLDMGHRDTVLDIIFDNFKEYQIIMMTHDRLFFEVAKHKIKQTEKDDWHLVEMYDTIVGGIPQPFIKISESYLDKANKYFNLNEDEIAGNQLRKEAESFCKVFLPKRLHYNSEHNLLDLNSLIIKCIEFANGSGLNDNLFKQLDTYRKFVLNAVSHDSYDVPKYHTDIGKALKAFEKLPMLKFETILTYNDELYFELFDGTDHFRFEIVIHDELKLLKYDIEDSVLGRIFINYKVLKNNVSTTRDFQHGIVNLKTFYENAYSKSDKSKSGNFWDDIIITSDGLSLTSKRQF